MAEQLITPGLQETTAADPQYPWVLAECYSLLNKQDLALKWLEKAVDNGFLNYPMIGRWDPLLANVRQHPGFRGLLNRTRDLWEKFEV